MCFTVSIRRYALSGLAALLSLFSALPTVAQIQPDETLGDERSLVTEDAVVRGELSNLIEGGATRGGNLFHSFLEFNVDEGQRVYFTNPVGIESILGRVTGENPSNIFGLLGVDGGADLFLMNPNGIVFGEAATFDIEGSFYGTTGDAVELGNEVFSAVEPESSRLLHVSPSILLENYLLEDSGDIESRGQLAVLGDLVLAGNGLDLQGQVAAGGDLTLLGLDEVRIRDTEETPFIGFAGGDLLVQGNQQVDIVALSHPDSGLFSYGDMILRSEAPVGGDAHYWSGGGFRVEALSGDVGTLESPIDPIIRAIGDVFIDQYTGTSLHILAGGAVTIGVALITAPDIGGEGADFLQETLRLSDGTILQINGSSQATLDVRAGVLPTSIGIPVIEPFLGFDPNVDSLISSSLTEAPSTANINIGDVIINAPNSLVFLTNQYEANNVLIGDIEIETRFADGGGIFAGGLSEQGGQVFFDARDSITVTDSSIGTFSTGASGGEIVLLAEDTILFESPQGKPTIATSSIPSGVVGNGSDIRIEATNLEMREGAALATSVVGDGQAGDIVIEVSESALFSGFNTSLSNPSGATSGVNLGGIGRGGNIKIIATNLQVMNGAQLSASTSGSGDAGDVILKITGDARFDGSDPTTGSISRASSSIEANATGDGGNVELSATNLEVTNGAQLIASTFGDGNAGNVILRIADAAHFDGTNPIDRITPSGAFSTIEPGGEGSGGNVELSATSLRVTDGAQLTASTFGDGNAGNVVLRITDAARFDGTNPVTGIGASGASSNVNVNSTGNGGNVELSATNLEVTNGAQLIASTFGDGNAGNVILRIADTARFDGTNPIDRITPSGAFSTIEPGGEGSGGNVELSATSLRVTDGARLSSSTFGDGNAGNVILRITDAARFDNVNSNNGSPSGALSTVERGGKGSGGRVMLSANTLEVSNGAQIAASTFGNGDAGDVTVTITESARIDGINPFTLANRSAIFSTVEESGSGRRGGNVIFSAQNLEVKNGAAIAAAVVGEGDSGNTVLNISETARFIGTNPFIGERGSSASSSVSPLGTGQGGNLEINARNVEVFQGARLAAANDGIGNAGSLVLNITDHLIVDDATIAANSRTGTGGRADIQSGTVVLRNDGDIQSFVNQGEGGGGNIIIVADIVIALDDSDILAFAADGRGGEIDLSQATLFSENLSPTADNLTREELFALDGNAQVDINATGGIASGNIFINDASFVENSINELSSELVDTTVLTAGSCISRLSNDRTGSFVVTGSEGLPQQPGTDPLAVYPTDDIRAPITSTATSGIQEAHGVYQLTDGRLVLSHDCGR